ncbi:ABC transporter permease [Leisingera sp.]|uniref:ABC transporter permease n=1 Tax=Leisingera sp. TaxID=1879318 RepID=UPI002B2769E3|nr:ABC transporter permease subunit [Leisingera sp.]
MSGISDISPKASGRIAYPDWKALVLPSTILFTLLVWMTVEEGSWLHDYPESRVWEIATSATVAVKYLVNEFSIGGVNLAEVTRDIADVIAIPMRGLQGLLAEGFTVYHDDGGMTVIPSLPWPAVVLAMTLFAWWAAGSGVAFLTFSSLMYFLLFGLWLPAMLTLSSVLVAVLVSFALGLMLGVWGYRSPRANAVLMPIYDVMQTIPTFSYLVPVLLLFGFNPVAAMIATVIYAMPPMARVTTLALQRVPSNINDFGSMSGCTRGQKMWLVMVPAARQNLLIGLNQVIMLTFAMVIIASVIGAGGLGGKVYQGLKALKIGNAVEAGIAITLMAIALDRISSAIALRRPNHTEPAPAFFWQQHKLTTIVVLFTPAAYFSGYYFPALQTYPEILTVSTGSFWNDAILWVSDSFYTQIKAVREGVIGYAMRPIKNFLLDVPWSGFIAIVTGLAYWAGGRRLALVSLGLLGFIAITGYWDAAMISLYLVALSVVVTLVLALPIGIWAGLNESADRIVTPIIDTLQTLPSFVYLIPVVMLVGVGEFAGLIAIVAYSLPPGVRYAKQGIRNISRSNIEVADMSGCTAKQKLWHVQLPLALPDIMLGINQTVMFAFGMLVITALVGTRGLEHDTLVAIAKVQPGEGIVAGLGIAFLSIITDRLIGQASRKLQQRTKQKNDAIS